MADPGHEVPQAGCRSQSSLPGAENGRQVDVRATTALSCGSCGWRDRFAHVWKCKGDSPPILVPMQPQVALRQLCLQPELLTPGTTILSLQDPKLSHRGAEQEDSQAPLQTSFLRFVSHQPSLLDITRDSVSLCCSSIVLPIQKSTVCQHIPPWLQMCVQHLSPQHFWTSLHILML